MRKMFEEPEVRKIEINLRESIADGSDGPDGISITFATVQGFTGCLTYVTETLPNPGNISGNELVQWIVNNVVALSACSMNVETGPTRGLFAAPSQVLGRGTVTYEVPKDVADAHGMIY